MTSIPATPELVAMLGRIPSVRALAASQRESETLRQRFHDEYLVRAQEYQAEQERFQEAEMLERKIQADREEAEREQAFRLQNIGARLRESPSVRRGIVPSGHRFRFVEESGSAGPVPSGHRFRFADMATIAGIDEAAPVRRAAGRAVITGPAGTLISEGGGPIMREALGPPRPLTPGAGVPRTGRISYGPDNQLHIQAVEREPVRGTFTRGTRDISTAAAADDKITSQLTYLQSRAAELPPEQYEGLRSLVAAGGLTSNQLVQQVEDAVKPRREAGRSREDVERSIVSLKRKLAEISTEKPPRKEGGRVRGGDTPQEIKLRTLIAEEESLLEEKRLNPNKGRSIIEPLPTAVAPPLSKTPTEADLEYYYGLAGGDPDEMRRLMREAGFILE